MKLKPILIASEKSIIGKLMYHKDKLIKYPQLTGKNLGDGNGTIPYDIILIDPTAEIIDGDLYIDDTNRLRISVTSDKSYWNARKDYNKVIAATKDLDDVPQLSQQSIDLLIEYYNVNGSMPESVEIETGGSMEDFQSYCGSLGLEWNNMVGWVGSVKTGWRPNTSELEDQFNKQIKLNQQGEIDTTIPEDVIIPRSEESQTSIFTNSEGINHLQWIFDRMVEVHKENPNYDYMLKLKSISEQITYTEDEVRELLLSMCHDTSDYMMGVRKNEINTSFSVDEWFSTRKK